MKFKMIGVELRLSRVGKNSSPLTLKDVQYANDETLSYLRELSIEEIDRRIDSVVCSLKNDNDRLNKLLSKNGIIIIPDFIPRDVLDQLSIELEAIKRRTAAFSSSTHELDEESEVLFQKGKAKLASYQELSTFKKAVVQVRQGQDEGMVDIFNVDKCNSIFKERLRPYFEQKTVAGLMGSGKTFPQAENLNLYLNSSIERTRGFHVDSYSKQLKAFIYLEDCLDLESGPYTYVKGSHRETHFTKINKHISSVLPNKTETPMVSLENIIPVLARKGALVISDQGGSHRGFPQAKGHQRAVAVMNFR